MHPMKGNHLSENNVEHYKYYSHTEYGNAQSHAEKIVSENGIYNFPGTAKQHTAYTVVIRIIGKSYVYSYNVAAFYCAQSGKMKLRSGRIEGKQRVFH